jgi:hypothetical protein
MVLEKASGPFAEWLRDRKNSRQFGHRFRDCGYTRVGNPDDRRDGQWRIRGSRQTIYAQIELLESERYQSAYALVARSRM